MTLPQLLVWSTQTEEITIFFSKFKLDGPQMMSQKVLQDNEFVIFAKHNTQGLNYEFPPCMGVTEVK